MESVSLGKSSSFSFSEIKKRSDRNDLYQLLRIKIWKELSIEFYRFRNINTIIIRFAQVPFVSHVREISWKWSNEYFYIIDVKNRLQNVKKN